MAAHGQRAGSVALNLESELTCSICTELLYQPLTLLDCLHTFCGSCLKEWFQWQGRSAAASSDDSRRGGQRAKYTCPACRAGVRDTKVDAKVNTLLDVLLRSDPSKAKSDDEKKRIREIYTPGESVFDERDQGYDGALGNAGIGDEPHDVTDLLNRMVIADDDWQDGGWLRTSLRSETTAIASNARDATLPSRPATVRWLTGVDRQPSLRAMMSGSNVAPVSERESQRRAIQDELLDDISFDTLTPAREGQVIDQLTGVDRRRHGSRQSVRAEQQLTYDPDTTRSMRSDRIRRPLFEPPPLPRIWQFDEPSRLRSASRHRSSSRHNRNDARRSSGEASREMERSHTSHGQRGSRRSSSNSLASDSSHRRDEARDSQARDRSQRRRCEYPTSAASVVSVANGYAGELRHYRTRHPNADGIDCPSAALGSSQRAPSSDSRYSSQSSQTSRQSRSETTSNQPMPVTTMPALRHSEPVLSCAICSRNNIQREVHKVCPQCYGEDWATCNRCYRQGNGCPHRLDYNDDRFPKHALPSATELATTVPPTRTMLSRRYLPPSPALDSSQGTNSHDPVARLQEGAFCDMCGSFADSCFWKCDLCNDGEWGFCNNCVNRGKCCTHHLLPLARVHQNAIADDVMRLRLELAPGQWYTPLNISTDCNICSYQIPTSATRFHCPKCQDGDYDVCTGCYTKLRTTSRIRREDGPEGWRRCLRGHRMSVLSYEYDGTVHRRVVVKDIVGGHALRDTRAEQNANALMTREPSGSWSWVESSDASVSGHRSKALRRRHGLRLTSLISRDSAEPSEACQASQFPPSGGVGLRLLALWSHYPEPHVKDEIMFPRGAEITEAENINNDWYWGCYAGQRGLFPGRSHVQVLEEVTGSPQ